MEICLQNLHIKIYSFGINKDKGQNNGERPVIFVFSLDK